MKELEDLDKEFESSFEHIITANQQPLDGKIVYNTTSGLPHGCLAIGHGALQKVDVLAAAKGSNIIPSNSLSHQNVLRENQQLVQRNIAIAHRYETETITNRKMLLVLYEKCQMEVPPGVTPLTGLCHLQDQLNPNPQIHEMRRPRRGTTPDKRPPGSGWAVSKRAVTELRAGHVGKAARMGSPGRPGALVAASGSRCAIEAIATEVVPRWIGSGRGRAAPLRRGHNCLPAFSSSPSTIALPPPTTTMTSSACATDQTTPSTPGFKSPPARLIRIGGLMPVHENG